MYISCHLHPSSTIISALIILIFHLSLSFSLTSSLSLSHLVYHQAPDPEDLPVTLYQSSVLSLGYHVTCLCSSWLVYLNYPASIWGGWTLALSLSHSDLSLSLSPSLSLSLALSQGCVHFARMIGMISLDTEDIPILVYGLSLSWINLYNCIN